MVTEENRDFETDPSDIYYEAHGNLKLTDWEKEPNITMLTGDLQSAKQDQQALLTKIDEWDDYTQVKGKAKIPKRKGRSQYTPKLIRKQNEWRYSAITEPFHTSEKLFNVEPVSFEDEDAAKQSTTLLNWQFRTKIDRIKFIDDLVRATVDEGSAIVRLGWKVREEEVTEDKPEWTYYPIMDQQSMGIFSQALEAKQANPRGFETESPPELVEAIKYFEETNTPNIAVQTGVVSVTEKKVVDNYPTVEVMDMRNIYIDPTCRSNLNDALFIINAYEVYQAELNENRDLYKNLDKINWESSGDTSVLSEHFGIDSTRNFSDPMKRKKVAYDYWGYYDIHNEGILRPILATWIDNTIIRMVENPYPDGKPPFVITNYMPIKRKLFGEPDAEILKDNQDIIGALYRGMIEIIGRSANAQTGFMKGAIDDYNLGRFEKQENFELNPNNLPNGGIINFVHPEVPQSATLLVQDQNNEAEALTGVKSFSGGISGNAYGNVATNTRGALDASSKREMAILRRIAEGVKKIGYKIIAMNSEFLQKEEVIRVTNKEYVTITRDDVKGNFDLIIDVATAEAEEAKFNDLSFIFQTVAPVIQDPQLQQIILSSMIELKRMPTLAEQVRTYQRQPTPEEQRMMELEMQVKEMELAKLQSEVEVNLARAEELRAKAQSEMVDSQLTADGTKHVEGMERAQAQAQANMELENVKSNNRMAEKFQDHAFEASNKEADKVESDKNKPAPVATPVSPIERDQFAKENPILNLGSSKFDPSTDPSLNLAKNRM